MTDYAEGELFQILEDDGSLPEEQVGYFHLRQLADMSHSNRNDVIPALYICPMCAVCSRVCSFVCACSRVCSFVCVHSCVFMSVCHVSS